MNFEKVNLNEIESINPFRLIGNDWMLITAGSSNDFNTMTASWGGLGVLWNKKVAFCFVRPQRYTFEFLEKNEGFTLSFFEDKYKAALGICGKLSGRNCNKIKEASLTPCQGSGGDIYFKEAKMVLACKKIYAQFVSPECLLEKELEKNYEMKDYHKMFVGEIKECLVRS